MDKSDMALAVAFISMCISAANFIWSQRHNRKTIKPALNMLYTAGVEKDPRWSSPRGVFSVILRNNGLGPAIIDKLELYIDGREIAAPPGKQWEVALETLLPRDADGFINFKLDEYTSFALPKNYHLPSNKDIQLLTVHFNPIYTGEISEVLRRSSAKVHYHSLHDDKDVYDSLSELSYLSGKS